MLFAAVDAYQPRNRRTFVPESVDLTLVNTDPLEGHAVTVQGGAFGEHRFDSVSVKNGKTVDDSTSAGSGLLNVSLGPWAKAELRIQMSRYAYTPSYEFPEFIRD